METLARAANRGSISTGYDIDNSIKTQANAGNEWFYRSSPTTGNKRTFTFSFWIKRTQLDGYQADNYLMSQGTNARFHFAGHTLRFMFDGGTTELEASAKLRDTSAWYHVVLAVDTTQSTAANRVKAYLNGQDYDWNNTKYPSLNQESSWMSGTSMYFNTRDGDGSYDNSGYWSEVVVVDGQQLDPTSFGEFDEDSGIWKPKDLSDLTFGSEGFYYKFDNAGSLGEDSSGNSNDATLNNITSANQATDTPTNNFATLNPLLPFDEATIFEGSTRVKKTSTNRWRTFASTQGVLNGKWYAEFQNPLYATTGINRFVGVIPVGNINGSLSATGDFTGGASYLDSFGFYHEGKYWENDNGSVTENTYGSSWANGETIGIALDMDNGYAYFSINGTYQNSGDPTSGATGTGGISLLDTTQAHYIAVSIYNDNADFQCNYGGYTVISISSAASDANGYGTFEYAPPSGYYALCTKNLAEYG